jgi:hypothetical protein
VQSTRRYQSTPKPWALGPHLCARITYSEFS